MDLERIAKDLPEETRKKILQTGANYQLRSTRENLRGEHGPDGSPWPALSQLTLRRKKGPKMLWESQNPAQLVRSVEVDAETIRIGTNNPTLARHQGGVSMRVTKKQSVWMWANLFEKRGSPFGMFGKLLRIPARPFLGFSDADQRELEQIAARWAEEEFKK